MLNDLRSLPRNAWVICAGTFLNKFGNFVNVFIVLYLTTHGHSILQAGIALGVIGLGSMVGNLLGGAMADRFGRRTTLVISMFASGVITMLVPLFTSYLALVVWLGLLGIVAQLFRPAAGALLVDSVEPAQRLTAFAVLRLAINVGMAVGPAVGGLLSTHSYNWLFIGDGITSLLYGVLALVCLKDERQPTTRESGSAGTSEKVGYRAVFRDSKYVMYLLSMVAATFVYVQSTATLPLHTRDNGMTAQDFGLLLGLNALIVVVLELPITRATGRLEPRRAICIGLVVLGAGMAATGLASGMAWLALTVVGWTIAEMVYTPVANAYPGEVAPDWARGRYQGAEGLAHTVGATAGPVIGTAVYAWSTSAHWWLCLGVGLVGACLVMFARAVPNTAGTEPSFDSALERAATGSAAPSAAVPAEGVADVVTDALAEVGEPHGAALTRTSGGSGD